MAAKILVADDDKNISEVLKLYLTKEGYEVCVANDGEAALAAFRAETPQPHPSPAPEEMPGPGGALG